jgi:hypothetical protein
MDNESGIVSIRQVPAQVGRPRFFDVSLTKFFIMSLATFGLYNLYWFYKQWQSERSYTREDLSPFWRTAFATLWAFSLFRRIKAAVERARPGDSFEAIPFAIAYFVLSATVRLPDPAWLVTFFSVLPLLPAQAAINRVNTDLAPSAPHNDRFTASNVIVIVVGVLMLALAIIGALFPDLGASAGAPPVVQR